MATGTPPTLYLRYEDRHLPPEWTAEILKLETILARYRVRVVSLTERMINLSNPKMDLLATSDAMLAIVGKEESTVLLAAGELPRFNRTGKPNMVIHNASNRVKGIWTPALVEAKNVDDLVRQMNTFVAETIGADLPDLRAELESTPTQEAANPQPTRRRAHSA
jgi:hypothetical protein